MLEILLEQPEQAAECGHRLAQIQVKLQSVKVNERLQSIKSRLAETINRIRHVGFEPFRGAILNRLAALTEGNHLCH